MTAHRRLVEQALELVVGHEARERADVLDADGAGRGVQVRQVRALPGDHGPNAGDGLAHLGQRVDERLEALLVLDPAPRHEQRLVAATTPVLLRRGPLLRVDAVRHDVDLVAGELERVHDLVAHEL